MNEEEKKAIESLRKNRGVSFAQADIISNLIDNQQKEIEELKKVIKMVEIYKSNGIPEDAEMVIMRKDDFLRNTNNEFISKDKIKEIIEKHYPYVALTKIKQLLEE